MESGLLYSWNLTSGPNPGIPDRAERVPTSAQSKTIFNSTTAFGNLVQVRRRLLCTKEWSLSSNTFFNLGNPDPLLKEWIVDHTTSGSLIRHFYRSIPILLSQP